MFAPSFISPGYGAKRLKVVIFVGLFAFVNLPTALASSSNTDLSISINSGVLEVHATNDASTGALISSDISVNVGDTVTITVLPQGYATDSVTVSSNGAISFVPMSVCEATGVGIGPNACVFEGVATSALTSTGITVSLIQREPGPSVSTVTGSFNLVIVDPNAPAQSPAQILSASRAAAEAERQAAISNAKTALLSTINSAQKPTLAAYQAADYSINKQETVDRINDSLLALAKYDTNSVLSQTQVAMAIKRESFVEYVSTQSTQSHVTSRQLVDNSIIAQDFKFKASVLRAIQRASVEDLNTYAKIKAAADSEIAIIQARKDRLAAIIKKVSGRS